MNKEENITITEKEYKQLLRDSQELQALQEAGVDNWGGCEYAYDILREGGFFDED